MMLSLWLLLQPLPLLLQPLWRTLLLAEASTPAR